MKNGLAQDCPDLFPAESLTSIGCNNLKINYLIGSRQAYNIELTGGTTESNQDTKSPDGDIMEMERVQE